MIEGGGNYLREQINDNVLLKRIEAHHGRTVAFIVLRSNGPIKIQAAEQTLSLVCPYMSRRMRDMDVSHRQRKASGSFFPCESLTSSTVMVKLFCKLK